MKSNVYRDRVCRTGLQRFSHKVAQTKAQRGPACAAKKKNAFSQGGPTGKIRGSHYQGGPTGKIRGSHNPKFRPILTRGVCIHTWGPPSISGKICQRVVLICRSSTKSESSHIISRLKEERMEFELADTKWYKETYNVADSDGLQDPMDVEDNRWESDITNLK